MIRCLVVGDSRYLNHGQLECVVEAMERRQGTYTWNSFHNGLFAAHIHDKPVLCHMQHVLAGHLGITRTGMRHTRLARSWALPEVQDQDAATSSEGLEALHIIRTLEELSKMRAMMRKSKRN